jgi:hypothetical protein
MTVSPIIWHNYTLFRRSRGRRINTRLCEQVRVGRGAFIESREIPLVKFGSLRDCGLFGDGVVKQPTLVTRGVTNKHTLLYVRLKHFPLILLHKDICSAPKHPKSRDIRFLAIGSLERCYRKQGGGQHV